jgi:hypothetical protein
MAITLSELQPLVLAAAADMLEAAGAAAAIWLNPK